MALSSDQLPRPLPVLSNSTPLAVARTPMIAAVCSSEYVLKKNENARSASEKPRSLGFVSSGIMLL